VPSDFERNEAVCLAFEAEWRAGRRPLAEEFLAQVPDAARPELLRELLRVEIECRHALDESPRPEEYVCRFPDLQREIYAAFGMSPPPEDNDPVCLILAGLLSARDGLLTERELAGRLVDWACNEDPRPSFVEVFDGSSSDMSTSVRRGGRPLTEQVRGWLNQHGNDKVKCLTALESPQADAVRSLLVHELEGSNDTRAKERVNALLGDLRNVQGGRFIAEEVARELNTRKERETRAAGGFGVVVLAHDRELDRRVALKELRIEHVHDADAYERFIQEAKIAGGLDHPGIVKIFGLASYSDGRPYFAMPYFKGGNLHQAIAALHSPRRQDGGGDARTLTLRDLVERMVNVCRAVAYAHSRGVLHRDLKPDNIMLGEFGETIVVDWGLAKIVPLEPRAKHHISVAIERQKVIKDPLPIVPGAGLLQSQIGRSLGTLPYSSPRQAKGEHDDLTHLDDVYSLGATFYEVITGVRAFRIRDDGPSRGGRLGRTQSRSSRMEADTETWASGGPRKAMLKNVIAGKFPPPSTVNPDVSPDLERVCLKAMARESWQRYQSAEELADDLELWLAGEPVRAWLEPRRLGSEKLVSREPRLRRAGRWLRRRSAPVTMTLLFSLAGLIALLASQVYSRANVLATELLTSPMAEYRNHAGKLKPHHVWLMRDLFREKIRAGPKEQKLRAMLALLHEDPSLADDLFKFLLEESRADELVVIREVLIREGYQARFAGRLSTPFLVRDAGVSGLKQGPKAGPPGFARSQDDKIDIRAAGALVAFDSGRFENESDLPKFVALCLVRPSPQLPGDWGDVFEGVKKWLRPDLFAIYEGRDFDGDPGFLQSRPYGAEERGLAYALLLRYADDDGPDGDGTIANLSALIGAADADQFREILTRIIAKGNPHNIQTAAKTLERSLDEHTKPDAGSARRFGQRAAALVAFHRPDKVWPWLTYREDSGPRAEIIHALPKFVDDTAALVARLRTRPDVSEMRALVLAIGQFDTRHVDKTTFDELRRDYREHPDAGLHSAIEWLVKGRGEVSAAYREDDEFLRERGIAHAKDHRWYINSAGMTMAVLPATKKFKMGSDIWDEEQERDEMEHDEEIKNSFDISTKEVTIRQYHRFLRDPSNADLLPKRKNGSNVTMTPAEWLGHIRPALALTGRDMDLPFMDRPVTGGTSLGHSPLAMRATRSDIDRPVTGVTWYEATRFCNWVSKQEGIEEYYPPHEKTSPAIEEAAAQRGDPLFVEKRSERTGKGYRLPAEKEWEYACRAGSTTPRPFGRSNDLLEHYGWYTKKSHGSAQPVGQKMPNDWGMFDMLGNASEWTQDLYNTNYDVPKVDDVVTNRYRDRVLRGGSFESAETSLRSAYRDRNSPSENPDASSGFRVARTR